MCGGDSDDRVCVAEIVDEENIGRYYRNPWSSHFVRRIQERRETRMKAGQVEDREYDCRVRGSRYRNIMSGGGREEIQRS